MSADLREKLEKWAVTSPCIDRTGTIVMWEDVLDLLWPVVEAVAQFNDDDINSAYEPSKSKLHNALADLERKLNEK